MANEHGNDAPILDPKGPQPFTQVTVHWARETLKYV